MTNDYWSNKKCDKLWKITAKDLENSKMRVFVSANVSIATGHHGTPRIVEFPGQETFPGKLTLTLFKNYFHKDLMNFNLKKR